MLAFGAEVLESQQFYFFYPVPSPSTITINMLTTPSKFWVHCFMFWRFKLLFYLPRLLLYFDSLRLPVI
ncbi:hypothetical protein Lalb_Chr10g0102571 [Lupinus albus]|uniref:Uncharacterized protein n=1 Tax=Lupinus albus TaxID=3870 RepID=A0A6A4PWU2_LUPAL|nr:hypothetical protein Lalb_Chr10g0102571 [Lupinus albus]